MGKKNIGRTQEAKIKKKLRNFAKEEFRVKKPLEIHVLKVKPKIILKKRAINPNLVIKKLGGASYIIYSDYGDQLRFYYYNEDGMMFDNRNCEKTNKMLKEIRQDTTTLFKYPIIKHEIGLEKENKFLSGQWKRLIKRSARKFRIHTKTLPAISIRKSTTINNIRIGVKQNKDFIYFEYAYYNSDLQDTILLREIFPILTKTQRKNETIQIISTMWAITQSNSSAYIKKITEIKEIDVNRKIHKEAIEWIIKKLAPFLAGNSIRKKDFAEFLIRSLIIIEKSDIFNQKELIDIFLLWLLEYGIKHYFDYGPVRAKYWLYYELLEIYYFFPSLCKKYNITPQPDSSYPIIHLCCRAFLEKDLDVDYSGIDPKYAQLENALRNLNFPGFIDLIPEPILTKNKDFLHEVLLYLLKSKGIKVECAQEIEIPVNSKKNLEMRIKNKTDWCLDDIEFIVETFPKNRIDIKELNHPKLLLLRDDIILKIKMESRDITGKCDLRLFISFRNPLNQKKIEKLAIKTIDVRVIPYPS